MKVKQQKSVKATVKFGREGKTSSLARWAYLLEIYGPIGTKNREES